MEPNRPTSELMSDFRAQLLRWNPQINLISRQSTEQRIDSLIEQGLAGAGAVAKHLGESGDGRSTQSVIYFDLGSGGGMPGIVWHCRLSELGFSPATYLIEPRFKRAWFLERLRSISMMKPFNVLCGRWGEEPVSEHFAEEEGHGGERSPILISLKALKLTDKQIAEIKASPLTPSELHDTGKYPVGRRWISKLKYGK